MVSGTDRVALEEREDTVDLSPAWLRFIAFCRRLNHGEIQSLKIQDGVPVFAEAAVRKIKF